MPLHLDLHRRHALALLLVAAPTATQAQSRHSAGLAGVYGQPLGPFRQNVDRGLGLNGAATFGIDSRGILGLRGELGYLRYDSNTEDFAVATGYGGYVLVQSQTTSGILTMGVGPQLTLPLGPLRPYVAALIGFSNFATRTSLSVPANSSETGMQEDLGSRTHSSDFVLSRGGAAGLVAPIPGFGNSGFLLDLSVRYHQNGEARYVKKGDVRSNGTAVPTVSATQSEANFIAYRLGVVIPL